MRTRVLTLAAAAVVALSAAGSAFAFDCIRVSGSWQGLQNSTRSGNWLAFDLSSGPNLQATLAGVSDGEIALTSAQAECVYQHYAAANQPQYFALGIGVAGGRTENGSGVLAHNAPDSVLSNGTGIDHIDDTVLPALLGAFAACA